MVGEEGATILKRIIRENSQSTDRRRLRNEDIWVKGGPGRRESKCKGGCVPEMFRSNKEVRVAHLPLIIEIKSPKYIHVNLGKNLTWANMGR